MGHKHVRDAQGSSAKSKRRFFQNSQTARSGDLAPGMRGVLISCDVHVERDAIRECFRIFEGLDDEDDTRLSVDATAATPCDSAGSALARELAKLKEKDQKHASGEGTRRRFSVAQTGCAGNVFIRCEGASVDPVRLVTRVMEQAISTQTVDAPHVIRMLPIQLTCAAKPSTIEMELKSLLTGLVGYDRTYAVQWRRRCNTAIDKMAVIDAAASAVAAVAPKARVDLNKCETGILIDVIKTTCCVSVLPDWSRFHQYNLRALADKTASLSNGNSTAREVGDEPVADPKGSTTKQRKFRDGKATSEDGVHSSG